MIDENKLIKAAEEALGEMEMGWVDVTTVAHNVTLDNGNTAQIQVRITTDSMDIIELEEE